MAWRVPASVEEGGEGMITGKTENIPAPLMSPKVTAEITTKNKGEKYHEAN